MTEVAAPEFPPGVDWRPYLRDLYHSAFRAKGKGAAAVRRDKTWDNPVAFAFFYLHHYVSDSLTGDVSFSPLHLALADEAVRWVEPGAHRSAWVAPRAAGKSAWLFVILPLWALAHGHRKYMLSFSYTEKQAAKQFRKLRTELERNEPLLNDFPNLRPRSMRTDRIVLPDGLIEAAGLLETSLG